MKAFARMHAALDGSEQAAEKVGVLVEYFRSAPLADAAWALWFLSGRRVPTRVRTAELKTWAGEWAGLPPWLVEECCEAVGDPAEALALLLPPTEPGRVEMPALGRLVEERLLPLASAGPRERRALVERTWKELEVSGRFLWNRLLTGGFRGRLPSGLLVQALAQVAGVAEPAMAHRWLGEWDRGPAPLARLLRAPQPGDDAMLPYPFCLATPLERSPQTLGNARDWLVEWMHGGLRIQVVRRAGEVVLWSKTNQIVTPWFPEIAEAAGMLADGTVLDGQLVGWREGGARPLAARPRRPGYRGRESRPAECEGVSVVLMVFDLLEIGGVDWRGRPLAERRAELERCLASVPTVPERSRAAGGGWVQGELGFDPWQVRGESALRLSPAWAVEDWSDVIARREGARGMGMAGVVLKRREAGYAEGRRGGAWWKWKAEPWTCHAVLVAARSGQGGRESRFSDYTFAVWHGATLIPVAGVPAGLSDQEIDELDVWIRAHIIGRFGPVRRVAAVWVFELGFDGVVASRRHKAGLTLRAPRMRRWRRDKQAKDADTLGFLQGLTAGGAENVP